jgi:hypothetical protein
VILYIGAGLALVACCGINILAANEGEELGGLALFLGALLAGAGVLNAVLGYYVMQGRQWARITTIVFCAIGILGVGLQLLVDSSGALSNCVSVIINGAIIALLSSEAASDFFRQGP